MSIATAAVSKTTATMTCPNPFTRVLGGGYSGLDNPVSTTQYSAASYPNTVNSWTVTLNETDADWAIYAICSQ